MSKSIEQAREQAKAMIQSMITLASAALGLVCALAWNEAIKTAMKGFWARTRVWPGFLPTRYWRRSSR